VAPGLAADLVVVDGDPYELSDISARITQVWKAGQRVERGPDATRTAPPPASWDDDGPHHTSEDKEDVDVR
jgi:hypothetical protein